MLICDLESQKQLLPKGKGRCPPQMAQLSKVGIYRRQTRMAIFTIYLLGVLKLYAEFVKLFSLVQIYQDYIYVMCLYLCKSYLYKFRVFNVSFGYMHVLCFISRSQSKTFVKLFKCLNIMRPYQFMKLAINSFQCSQVKIP